MEKLRIDFVSDIMCPWCIIGYKQVEKALDMLENPVDAEIWWHPFELNPNMPEEGQNAAEHIAQKYGTTPEQSKANRDRLKEIGTSLGFEFSGGEDMRIQNSFKAHKLLTIFGRERGSEAQTKLKLALFEAHFQKGVNVNDETALIDIAEAQGMDRNDARRWLADDALSLAVREEEAHWQSQNISGVPAIIFDQKFMVPGAQSAETFANVIGKVLTKRTEAA